MELLITRHAPTVNNIKGIFMGVDDVEPTTEGLEQASSLKSFFVNRPITICYTSPLKRAKYTAEAIFPKEMIFVTDRLIERDLGNWAGISKTDVKNQYPRAFNDEGLLDFFYTPPKGEDAKIMIDRLVEFLIDLKKYDEDTLVAIVTHNGVYRVLKALITGMPLKEIFREFENYLEPKSFSLSKERIDYIADHPYETAGNKFSRRISMDTNSLLQNSVMNRILVRKLSFSTLRCGIKDTVTVDWSLRGHIDYKSEDIIVTIELLGDNRSVPIEIDIVVEGRISKFLGWNSIDKADLAKFSVEQLMPVVQTNVEFLSLQSKANFSEATDFNSLECEFL